MDPKLLPRARPKRAVKICSWNIDSRNPDRLKIANCKAGAPLANLPETAIGSLDIDRRQDVCSNLYYICIILDLEARAKKIFVAFEIRTANYYASLGERSQASGVAMTNLSDRERELALAIDFDPEILAIAKAELPDTTTFQKLELSTWTYEDDDDTPAAYRFDPSDLPAAARVERNVTVPWTPGPVVRIQTSGAFFELPAGEGLPLILKLRPVLAPKGYTPIALDWKHRERLFGEDLREALAKARDRALIGIVPFSDPYDIVRFFGTGAGNYGMDNRDIIAKLKAWEQRCEFEILGAGGDTLRLAFRTLPDDLLAFAGEVDAFCPDLMGQGYIGEPLGEDATMEDFGRAMDEQTVEDLADYIERNRQLNFWWD